MTYRGNVKNGVVVLDGPELPAEGTVVRVEEITPSEHHPSNHPSWSEVFKDLIGAAEGLPEDLARTMTTISTGRRSNDRAVC